MTRRYSVPGRVVFVAVLLPFLAALNGCAPTDNDVLYSFLQDFLLSAAAAWLL